MYLGGDWALRKLSIADDHTPEILGLDQLDIDGHLDGL